MHAILSCIPNIVLRSAGCQETAKSSHECSGRAPGGQQAASAQLKSHAEVQAAERALCAHLNALAGHLLADVLESETPQARSKRLKQAQHQVSSSGKEHAPPEEGGEQPDQRCGSAIDNWRRLSTAKGKKKQGKQELPEQEVTGLLKRPCYMLPCLTTRPHVC